MAVASRSVSSPDLASIDSTAAQITEIFRDEKVKRPSVSTRILSGNPGVRWHADGGRQPDRLDQSGCAIHHLGNRHTNKLARRFSSYRGRSDKCGPRFWSARFLLPL